MTEGMTNFVSMAKKRHLGIFSCLLRFVLKKSLQKYELRRTKTTGVFLTKLELRNVNANPFLIRKVYITPSNILHEGPYREEKCAVTREFVKYQDRFLRVTFRDEGKIKIFKPDTTICTITVFYQLEAGSASRLIKANYSVKEELVASRTNREAITLNYIF